MEITKEEVEKLLGYEIVNFKVRKTYRGYKVVKLNITVVKKHDPKEVVITVSKFVTVKVTFPLAAVIKTLESTGKAPFVGTALTTTLKALFKFSCKHSKIIF